MAKQNGREALRGAEVHVLDLIFQVSTSKQWAKLLKGPLQRAAAQGNRGIAQKLVDAGAKIGDALHEAIEGGYVKLVADLLENGASTNAKDTNNGATPLHVAAKTGKPEMVELLMLKGADKDAMGDNNWTPLYTAARFGNATAALALLAGGADVGIRCGGLKKSVVDVAAGEGHVDIMRAAIEHGADVNAATTSLTTALHSAADRDEVEAIDALLKAGSNIEARSTDGFTPLHCAASTLSLEALAALVKHGAHVNAQDGILQTPLYFAATGAGVEGAAEVVNLLLRSGADETIVDRDGKAAADVVAEDVDEEVRMAEDVERVRKLLANAPADRAWRRRGYLVMCRAHPDRVHQAQDSSSGHIGTGRRTRSGSKLAKTDKNCSYASVEESTENEQSGGEWAVVVANVLGLQEAGIFRKIVGYL